VKKLIFLIMIIIGYFWLFGFTAYYINPIFHLTGFIIVSLYFLHCFSISEYLSALIVLLPLVLVFGVFGVGFHVFSVAGRSDWLEDTLVKVLFLPSSVLFVRSILSNLTFSDIINMKIPDKYKTDLIVFRTIVVRGSQSMSRLNWYIDNSQMHNGRSILHNKIPKYSALILSTYITLYQKAEMLYSIINNRNLHLKRSS